MFQECCRPVEPISISPSSAVVDTTKTHLGLGCSLSKRICQLPQPLDQQAPVRSCVARSAVEVEQKTHALDTTNGELSKPLEQDGQRNMGENLKMISCYVMWTSSAASKIGIYISIELMEVLCAGYLATGCLYSEAGSCYGSDGR